MKQLSCYSIILVLLTTSLTAQSMLTSQDDLFNGIKRIAGSLQKVIKKLQDQANTPEETDVVVSGAFAQTLGISIGILQQLEDDLEDAVSLGKKHGINLFKSTIVPWIADKNIEVAGLLRNVRPSDPLNKAVNRALTIGKAALDKVANEIAALK